MRYFSYCFFDDRVFYSLCFLIGYIILSFRILADSEFLVGRGTWVFFFIRIYCVVDVKLGIVVELIVIYFG